MGHISANRHTKEYGPKEELSILKDNLGDKVQKKYQNMCQEEYNILCWCYHPEYTYGLDPPESGAGNQIRFYFGVYLDEWLWDYVNVEQCYLGLFPDYH